MVNTIRTVVLCFHSTAPGESPPPAPMACYGRKELIENIVGLAENLEPVALIGAGGIGKTSIALTVLHHKRIENRFGANRRFIRCDQFPASRSHFIARLSKVIGAKVGNPEDMAPLRPFLSSKEMFIVLDNAESILDPQVTDHQGIYAVVDELCQFKTVCVCITSRITTVPRYCKRPQIPTLTMEAACDIFYGIYGNRERFEIIDNLLQRLDFHALSITLLAATAFDNAWDYNRLAKEWGARRAQALRSDHNESLVATIELSLNSPTFHQLGPNARDLLGVIAFFPQGVDENNLDWFFPTIPNVNNIFDKFCDLSLVYRRNSFTTMLAPIRDYLSPEDPGSSPLLCTIEDCYFTLLWVPLDPHNPAFGEARWITSEDLNVEHLLNVLTSIDPNSPDVWDACLGFIEHLYWHKPRHTVLRLKIEGLPDAHPSKPRCFEALSLLFNRVGNYADEKQLLTHLLILRREQGDDSRVARTLRRLSTANNFLGLRKEGIPQVEEALEIYERFGDTVQQAKCLHTLAQSLLQDDQLSAAEDAVLRTIDFLPEKGQEFQLCKSHRLLGDIYESKGEIEKAIDCYETALGIGPSFNRRGELFLIHLSLALLFNDEGEFDDANTHIERAKSYTVDGAFELGYAMEAQARIWHRQHRLEDAKSEASRALEIHEKLGETQGVKSCGKLLRRVERAMDRRSTR